MLKRKYWVMLALMATLTFTTILMLTPVAKAVEEDPFSYSPTIYSASVSQGGSTSPTIILGIKTPPTLPSSAFPVTTTGWDASTLPSAWTLTDAIQAPKTSYSWSSTSDTVSVALTLGVPTTASPTTYTFTLKLKPGTRADGGSAVGAGDGVAFTITVTVPTVSITVTSSPATGSGFVNVDGTPITTPTTFSWKPGNTHTLEALSPVSGGTGTQYVYTGWSDGGAQTHTYTVPSSATTVTATYDTYYKVHYVANVPVTVPADEWVKSDQAATGIFSSPQYNAAGDTKYVFVSDDRPTTITAPTTIAATYKTQYLVSFTQLGSSVAPTVDYTADTDPTGTVPFSVWVKADSQISYTYQAIVYDPNPGVRYVLTSTSPASPQTANGPLTILGTYKTQYEITATATPSGALGGTFKVTYTQCGTTYTSVEKNTEWIEWVDATTDVTVSDSQQYVPNEAGSDGVRYEFASYSPSATVTMGQPETITLVYETQYYLTVISPYDTPGGEGWYDAGDTAYATLVDGFALPNIGFVGWSGDASGWELLSDPITMEAPKTAIANWQASIYYGDVRTIGFWKHQVNVWYLTELAKTNPKIKGIGTAQVTQDDLMDYLKFISANSGYAKFQSIWVEGNKLTTLTNAYNILKTPTGPNSMKMRAEQQLLGVWLNFARKAFFWNTQLDQSTLYVYCKYDLWGDSGLQTIGEAISWSENQLTAIVNLEAVNTVCDSINNNLGIIWGT